jgi:hypothetical protein
MRAADLLASPQNNGRDATLIPVANGDLLNNIRENLVYIPNSFQQSEISCPTQFDRHHFVEQTSNLEAA